MRHIALVGLVLLISQAAFSWNRHHLVTRFALENHPIAETRVLVGSLDDLLNDLGMTSQLDLNLALQIRKDFRFQLALNERVGQEVQVLEVLSVYSDEPDWAMDTELFSDDQYPELWKDAYVMMGGQKGTPSQAFRHMFWDKFHLWHPLQSFKLPPNYVLKPLGQAHNRAELFLKLSREAQQLGHTYWSVRFLANAFHYIQDVANPFHASQTPTKKFITMPLKRLELSDFVKQVTNIISYYHFAFEDYVGLLMEKHQNGEVTEAGRDFYEALNSPDDFTDKKLDFGDKDAKSLVENMAKYAMTLSGRSGRAAIKFFPKLDADYKTVDPKEFMDEEWWSSVILTGETPSKAQARYFHVVRAMFEPTGFTIRKVVEAELAPLLR